MIEAMIKFARRIKILLRWGTVEMSCQDITMDALTYEVKDWKGRVWELLFDGHVWFYVDIDGEMSCGTTSRDIVMMWLGAHITDVDRDHTEYEGEVDPAAINYLREKMDEAKEREAHPHPDCPVGKTPYAIPQDCCCDEVETDEDWAPNSSIMDEDVQDSMYGRTL